MNLLEKLTGWFRESLRDPAECAVWAVFLRDNLKDVTQAIRSCGDSKTLENFKKATDKVFANANKFFFTS